VNAQNPVICIGEVAIELARGSDGRFGLGFNGDTFNTAVYLARAGMRPLWGTILTRTGSLRSRLPKGCVATA
jgi:sugar/nucleoside kinase (ribokinase family)